MSTVLDQAQFTLRSCRRCGSDFRDYSLTAPRSYCDNCVSRRRGPKDPVEPRTVTLDGERFTREHFREFTRLLRLKGGERFQVEDWELDFAEDVFTGWRAGWLKEAWLIVPEGNGKSTFISVLILYFLVFVEESKIPVAASSRDQAEIIFWQAEGFGRRSPALEGVADFKTGLREIAVDERRAKIFASDAGTGDGIIPFPLMVIDELHRHKDLHLYRTWAGKLDKEDAVLVVISTAGEPGSEFEDTRESMRTGDGGAERCFKRYVGETSILHEYALPPGGDVEDVELVKAANPSSRITVDSLRAKRARPSWSLAHWRRLTCNMPTRHDAVAIEEKEWQDAATVEEIPRGEPVWVGIDVAWKKDTTALVPLWCRDFRWRQFGPAVVLEPPRDGTSLEPAALYDAFELICNRNPVHTVVMDTSLAMDFASALEQRGIEVVEKTQHNPGAVLDYKFFMEALRSGWLKHSGDLALKQHALNAVAKLLPGGEVKFDRPKESRTVSAEESRRRVIDALVAAAMVHSVAAAELSEDDEIMVAFG